MTVGMSKYAVIRNRLAERISEMTIGDQLPTEPELCDEFEVSRITIRRAMDELASEGLVVREQGRGTFVADPRVSQHVRETFQNEVSGFYREQTAHNRKVTTDVLGNRVVTHAQAAAVLGLGARDELIELERLRYVNGALHQHVITYMSAREYPAVLAQDFSDGSLFDFLESRYGVKLTRNDLLVRLEKASGEIAEHLEVADGTALLAIDSTVFTYRDQPVAFGIARHTPANSEIAFSLRGEWSPERA